MAYTKLNFSRAALVGIPAAPTGKRTYYSDAKEPGLLLCVTATSTKSFQVYIKLSGRPERVTLGRFSPALPDSVELPRDCDHRDFMANTPELNIRMARSMAALVKIDLKAGIKPADVKKGKRDEMTVGELFEWYVTAHLIPKKKKSTANIRADFERYLGKIPDGDRKRHGAKRTKQPGSVNWTNRKMSSITHQEVQKLHDDLGKHIGDRTANIAINLLRAMYNQAIRKKIYKKENPASDIEKFRTPSRERFIQSDELPRFFVAVAEEPSGDVRDFVLLDLLSGARKNNVLSMRWADVNLDRAEWRLPDTKNGEPLTVPLMPEAVQVLRSRKPDKPAEFVFPGRGKTGHLADPRKGWERIFDRDELNQLTQRIRDSGTAFEWPAVKVKGPRDKTRNTETLKESLARARSVAQELEIDTTGARILDLHIHDMRRTLGSWQAATGASLVIIGKSLGHKDLASTAIYSRLDLDPVRNSMQTATRAMLVAGGLLPSAEIVPINKKAASA